MISRIPHRPPTARAASAGRSVPTATAKAAVATSAAHVSAVKVSSCADAAIDLQLYAQFGRRSEIDDSWTCDTTVSDTCLAAIGLQTDRGIDPDQVIRWIAEQEFVVAAVLLALGSRSTQEAFKSKLGAEMATLPHPVVAVLIYATLFFPQWGFIDAFSRIWASQVSVLFSVANSAAQKVISCSDGTVFRSNMECGNLARAEACTVNGATIYLLWTEGDVGTDKRLWFRFAVRGLKGSQAACFRIMNLAPNAKLYKNGMKPVWRSGTLAPWKFVPAASFAVTADDEGQLSFYFMAPACDEQEVHVAFTVPYGYGDLLRAITEWHQLVRKSAASIRFEERELCRTLDERKLHLLVITSQENNVALRRQSGNNPFSSFDDGKRVVLISGRVHPGEVSASHAVHGMISFLLSDDDRAVTLRNHFIFFVVPMLNPDGVARGHTRLDQRGVNLNRCYGQPSQSQEPTVFALKRVCENLRSTFGDRFTVYLDFHSHASQRKAFVFGNNHAPPKLAWSIAFAKYIEVHAPGLFDLGACKFSKADMVAKEGSSRVLFGNHVLHSYTVEVAHFFMDDGTIESGADGCCLTEQSSTLGRACLLAILDVCQLSGNPNGAQALRVTRAVSAPLRNPKKRL